MGLFSWENLIGRSGTDRRPCCCRFVLSLQLVLTSKLYYSLCIPTHVPSACTLLVQMGYLLRHLVIMPFAGHDYLSMYHQNWARKEHEMPKWMTWVPGIIFPHCVTAALPPEDQGQLTPARTVTPFLTSSSLGSVPK